MSDPWTDIVLKAAEMRIHVHKEFEEFLGAIKGLEERLFQDLAVANKDELQTIQGKVQVVQELRKKLANCINLREAIKRRG